MADVKRTMKLQIQAGEASPAPPLGPALGQVGVNIGEFVNQFNEATQDRMGEKVSVILNVYDDRSFDFSINFKFLLFKFVISLVLFR
jgi:large subunit ribosomal protein L11